MGKPAARLGDMTAHGGTITGPGCPTVLIGGMPAATLGDMHVCPMVTPGTPPIPHVGGPISLGSTGVLIGGKPAARMGDMAVCVGPPSSIVLGCMTVLIGEAGGGGGGGGGAGGAGAGGGSAAAGAITSAQIAAFTPQSTEVTGHFLEATVVDKGNLPVAGLRYSLIDPNNAVSGGVLSGEIKRTGVEEGNYELKLFGIGAVRWSTGSAAVGDKVDLLVDTIGIEDGTPVVLTVFIRDGNYADHSLAEIQTQISSDQAKTSWSLAVDEKYLLIADKKAQKKRYSQPFFFFRVSVAGLSEQSGILNLTDWVEISLKGEDGKAIGNKDYRVQLPTGEIREGTLDANGKAKIENVSPGTAAISFSLRSKKKK
jgi:uncharacterized Zn-binding protein involved in type VI secretion